MVCDYFFVITFLEGHEVGALVVKPVWFLFKDFLIFWYRSNNTHYRKFRKWEKEFKKLNSSITQQYHCSCFILFPLLRLWGCMWGLILGVISGQRWTCMSAISITQVFIFIFIFFILNFLNAFDLEILYFLIFGKLFVHPFYGLHPCYHHRFV